MNLAQAFKHLLKNWEKLPQKFRDKYKSYRSKYLRSLKDSEAEKIGESKIREMLLEAGYKETPADYKPPIV